MQIHTGATLYYKQCSIDQRTICNLISNLRCKKSPGVDNVTTENLQYGISDSLCLILSNVFSVMLSRHVVENDMLIGNIVPVLKKPTLNPNLPSNYRPITVSTCYSKLLELCLLPKHEDAKCSNTQFGFRKGLGTDMACSFANDLISYFNDKGSPVFACNLDAEKCFDRVWHDGLFYKLLSKVEFSHWLLLYEWYSNLKACIKWNGYVSQPFNVTRGIRQGSLLSPVFFTYFIDDLLQELNNTDIGLRIGHLLFNHFAYADDVSLFAANVPGLQALINLCNDYANRWRFVFGFAKTTCIIFGDHKFSSIPVWTLGDNAVECVNSVNILGVHFRNDLSSSAHVQTRISAARRKAFSLLKAGLTYPGLATNVKVYLWKMSVCPILLSGGHSIFVSPSDTRLLESFQSTHIKRIFGFPIRYHHSKLLEALGIKPVSAHFHA